MVTDSPASTSPMAVPVRVGSPPGQPVVLISPPMAWPMMSYPGRRRYGPVSPKPDTAPYTSRGLIFFSVS